MKYGNSEQNRTNGTILEKCVVEELWSDSKNDWVRYYYAHDVRTPSYKAYLPKGNLARLGVKVGKMYKVTTKKINGKYFWESVVELRRIVAEVPETRVTIDSFFDGADAE